MEKTSVQKYKIFLCHRLIIVFFFVKKIYRQKEGEYRYFVYFCKFVLTIKLFNIHFKVQSL